MKDQIEEETTKSIIVEEYDARMKNRTVDEKRRLSKLETHPLVIKYQSEGKGNRHRFISACG